MVEGVTAGRQEAAVGDSAPIVDLARYPIADPGAGEARRLFYGRDEAAAAS